MLGVIPTRGATIEAETMCFLWEINHKAIMPVLRECTELHDKFRTVICSHLEHSVTGRFSSLPLFNNFGRSFQMLLSLYSDRRVHFPGQKVARGGEPGDGLYILNVGLAKLEKNKVMVKMFEPGEHFGATIMLGIHKNCIANVEATEVCHVLVISRESYLMVLERYPSREVDRELKISVTRSYQQMQSTIKESTLRFQHMAFLSIKSPFNKEATVDAKTAFQAWRSHVADKRAVRKREAQEFLSGACWVMSRQRGRERRERRELQACVGADLRDGDPVMTSTLRPVQVRKHKPLTPISPFMRVQTPRTPRTVDTFDEPLWPHFSNAAGVAGIPWTGFLSARSEP